MALLIHAGKNPPGYDLLIMVKLIITKMSKRRVLQIFITLITFFPVLSDAQPLEFSKLSGKYLGQNPPGVKPEIFAPGIVSTDMYNHSSISISPDGKEIYWAMGLLDSPRHIYCSRLVNGFWSNPEIVSFTETEDGDCPILYHDGNRMLFNSNRPIKGTNTRRELIWCVEKVNGEWGEPYPVSKEVNAGHLHWQVSVDMDGNIYFGSERQGTKGRDDIFISEYIDGTYKEAVSLDGGINSKDHESTPFVSPDGTYLIFLRDGLQVSFKDENGKWSESVPLGKAYDGSCPYVSPDGKYLFFLRMGMGFNDVYWVSAKVINDLKLKYKALEGDH